MKAFFLLSFFIIVLLHRHDAQMANEFRIVGYYAGPLHELKKFETSGLTHLIYCFGHLQGSKFALGSSQDSVQIRQMVEMKKENPKLKVMLSLGGWGGCATCSDVFSSEEGRREFAQSVMEITAYFNTDGIDLDWEYPAIEGYPGHTFRKEDAHNFTLLLQALHEAKRPGFEISFAAGGFSNYIESSIEWTGILPYVDFINIMSYDLVHGYSTTSGHHTPLYSTPRQKESTDNAVQLLLQNGVPAEKMVIGAAFYGRFFEIAEGNEVDLYMPCRFTHGFSYRHGADSLSIQNGFEKRWDEIACAPYAINSGRRLVATYDDERSIALKTKYARENHLGGIMFWQLIDDKFTNGLLHVITSE